MTKPFERRTAAALTVNAEAGDYRITAEPAEQEAARAATERTWQEFPYYASRYGARGWRFTFSDGAWLVALCDHTTEAAEGQLRWLQELLYSRGMPSFLTEQHLRHLHEELCRRGPADRYRMLAHCIDLLQRERTAVLSDDGMRQLADGFEASVRDEACRVDAVGRIVVAAAIDAALGRTRSLDSVLAWAGDPERFSAAWIAAVERLVAQSRRSVGTPARTEPH